MIKILVIIAFLLIIISLGSALLHLIKNKSADDSEKILKLLTFRIGLSVVLFIFVAIALLSGAIKPQGIGARMLQYHQLGR